MYYLTSGSSEKNLSFEKEVSLVLSFLRSKRPRTFRWIIFSKTFFSIQNGIWTENFRALSKYFNKFVKNELYVSRETLWQKQYVDFVK